MTPVVSNYVYHNITGADKQALLLESLRVLKKGGVFALNDDMKPRMYGDMEAFVQKLRDMGYQEVRLIDTAHGGLRFPPPCGDDDAGRIQDAGGTKIMPAKYAFQEGNMSLEDFHRKYPAQTMTLGNCLYRRRQYK